MIPESPEMYQYCFCMFFASGVMSSSPSDFQPFLTKVCESHFYVGMGLFWMNMVLDIASCVGGV